jgi:DNA-directed RNA polymerase specialized sigma24 family protein
MRLGPRQAGVPASAITTRPPRAPSSPTAAASVSAGAPRGLRASLGTRGGGLQDAVAAVAARKRELLLRAYRDRLPVEDLEDCFSQATLELLLRARLAERGAGRGFEGVAHIANALEQKLRSRIQDRLRARGGRSAIEAALAGAVPIGAPGEGGIEIADCRSAIEDTVVRRIHLRDMLRLARRLSFDQRLLLSTQLQLDLSAREFCERFGWSLDKYRKVDQRARARLRALAAETASPVMRPDVRGLVGEGREDPPMNPSPLAHRRVPGGARGRPSGPQDVPCRPPSRQAGRRGPGCSPPAPPAARATRAGTREL